MNQIRFTGLMILIVSSFAALLYISDSQIDDLYLSATIAFSIVMGLHFLIFGGNGKK